MNHNTVRTFRAQDPKAALDIVKAMMGPDAVIISTREVGGNLFRRGEIEITAALPAQKPDSNQNKRAQKRRQRPTVPRRSRPPSPTTPPSPRMKTGSLKNGPAPIIPYP